MRRFFFFTAIILAASCASFSRDTFPAGTNVILPAEESLEVIDQCSRREPGPVTGTWTPDEKIITALEQKLPVYFQKSAPRWRFYSGTSPFDYYRQYAGLIIDGQKIIYINGFHRSFADDWYKDGSWRYRAVIICDGGSSLFGAEYDPTTGEFSNFSFNGVA